MPPGDRGRAGKFSKPRRGGGKHFSRDLQPLDKNGDPVSMWGAEANKDDDDSSEEDSSEEESSEESDAGPSAAQEMTREQRRAAAKAKKEAAIKKKNQKAPEVGDLPSDEDSDEEEDMPANPNHTAASRSQASAVPKPADDATPAASGSKSKGGDNGAQLSRREREALQAQQAKERYQKLHAEGKTDEARADLARLKLVKERREAEAARKKAEKEERDEQEKKRLDEMTEKERKKREAALGPAATGKGGKKKA